MRLNIIVILLFFGIASYALANPLETCLQRRLDAVLAGEAVREHAHLPGLVRLAIGKGNWQMIADNPTAIEEFVNVTERVISERITARGQDFIGATLDLIEDEREHVTEGAIIADGVPYNISVTFPDKESCQVYDISIHGAFTLRDWVRDQPEMKQLMKQYKMKQ